MKTGTVNALDIRFQKVTDAGNKVEKEEKVCIIDGHMNCMVSLKQKQTELWCNPIIPLLSVYLKMK